MLYNVIMINERLKYLRKNAKKTQRDMAKVLNISQNAYCKYELGTTEPNIQTINQLASYFNVDINYLLSEDDIESNNTAKTLTFRNDAEKEIYLLTKTLTDHEQTKLKGYIQGLIDNRTEQN